MTPAIIASLVFMPGEVKTSDRPTSGSLPVKVLSARKRISMPGDIFPPSYFLSIRISYVIAVPASMTRILET